MPADHDQLLPGLRDVPWGTLRHSGYRSSGEEIPGLLLRLADPATQASSVRECVYALEPLIGHCGMISEVAPAMVGFLARIAVIGASPQARMEALELLDDIAFSGAASADQAGDATTLYLTLQRELQGCRAALREVARDPSSEQLAQAAARLLSHIEDGIVPRGVVTAAWRDSGRPFLHAHAERVRAVVVDGRPLLVTTGHSGAATTAFWDSVSGKQVGAADTGAVWNSHVYAHGAEAVVVTAGFQRPAVRWSIPAGKLLPQRVVEAVDPPRGSMGAAVAMFRRAWPGRHSFARTSVAALAAYPDAGRTVVVTADRAGVIRRWDAVTGDRIGPPIRHLPDLSFMWTYELDGVWYLAAGGTVGQVGRWEARSGRAVVPLDGGRGAPLRGTSYTVDGRVFLATTGYGVRRWDARTGESFGEDWYLPDSATAICAYDVAGRTVLAAASFAQVHRIDALTGEPFGDLIQGHQEPIIDMCVIELNGRPVLFTCDGWSVWRWDAATGRPLPADLPLPA